MNKKYIIINIILTFLLSFITHNIYNWIPISIFTIFPVNESLFEHLKLILLTPLISNLILYLIIKPKIKNIIPSLIISIILNIIIFYVIYIPVYNIIGENMLFTLVWYFITIIISNIIYKNLTEKKIDNYKIPSIIILILLIITTVILTYYPPKKEFFRDPIKNSYGILKK